MFNVCMKKGSIQEGEVVEENPEKDYVNYYCESFAAVNGICVKPFKLARDPTIPCIHDTDCISE
jgi:hypothetical protein